MEQYKMPALRSTGENENSCMQLWYLPTPQIMIITEDKAAHDIREAGRSIALEGEITKITADHKVDPARLNQPTTPARTSQNTCARAPQIVGERNIGVIKIRSGLI